MSVLHSDVIGAAAAHAPAAGGTLVLAEPAGGWKATLNGRALTALAKPFDGWAQAFTLPAGGGRLVVTRDNMARDVSLFAELIAFLAVCGLALPGKRTDAAAEAAALQAARRGKRAGRSAPAVDAEEPESQAAEDAMPLSAARRPGHSPGKGRGQRGKRAEMPKRVPGRRVASSPGVAAITEGDQAAGSRIGVLDSGSDGFPGAVSVSKAGSGAWATVPSASAGPSGGPGLADGASRPGGTPRPGGNGHAGRGGRGGGTAPWEVGIPSDAGAGETPRSGWEAGQTARSGWEAGQTARSGWEAGQTARSGNGAGSADSGSDWGTDVGQPQSGEPGHSAVRDTAGRDSRAGRNTGGDNGADWTAVLAERDSGAWPTVSGGRPVGAPLPAGAFDAWGGDSGSGSGRDSGAGLDTRAGRDSGANETWRADSGPWSIERSTGGQPRESLGQPREAFEPAGARHGSAPQLAATRSAEASALEGGAREGSAREGSAQEGSAREAKPAERHSHRAPGRHGRPARRIWDRAGRDKDKDE